jgi:hypothetical protein
MGIYPLTILQKPFTTDIKILKLITADLVVDAPDILNILKGLLQEIPDGLRVVPLVRRSLVAP